MTTEEKNTPLERALNEMPKSELITLIMEIEQINVKNPKDAREQINQIMLDRIPGYVFI
jgi:hypothetical protein